MGQTVKEKDLKDLFWAVVNNLKVCMEDGSASPKDKEIALKLVADHQIGIEVDQRGHVDALDHPLPFDEMGLSQ